MLLQAARSNTKGVDEKDVGAMEDPGMDTLRGSFGTVGSIIRARSARRMSQSTAGRAGVGSMSGLRARHGNSQGTQDYNPYGEQPHYNGMGGHTISPVEEDRFAGMTRHQLYDPPMRTPPVDGVSVASSGGGPLVQSPSQIGSPRKLPAIKFDHEEIIHSYPVAGKQGDATHEHRTVGAFKDKGGVKTPAAVDGDVTYFPVRAFF